MQVIIEIIHVYVGNKGTKPHNIYLALITCIIHEFMQQGKVKYIYHDINQTYIIKL